MINPKNETARLEALSQYNILDSLPEKEYDDITKLASEICRTPISLITLLDDTRQWFKSRRGMGVTETPREYAFCGHTIMEPQGIMVVPDSRMDERFAANPLVTGEPHVIFYAGVSLINPEGMPLGTLCVIDSSPREINQGQLEALQALANQVVNLFELRKKNILLEQSQAELQNRYDELEKFAYIVSHDIKSPLNNMLRLTEMLHEEYGAQLDGPGVQKLGFLHKSSARLKELVDGLLDYYRGDQVLGQQEKEVELSTFLEDIFSLLNVNDDFEIRYPLLKAMIFVNKVALQQVMGNLLANAIKYNDKPKGIIEIGFSEDTLYYYFSVKDNGSGIAESDIGKIFSLFSHLGKKDRFNNIGTGIGLASVKKLVEKLGGEISVSSRLGEGSEFSFSIKKVTTAANDAISPVLIIS